MSYEEAIVKWAAKKFNLDVDAIDKVTLDPETRWGGYCETCEYSYSVLDVTVYGKGKNKYGGPEVLFTKDLEDVGIETILRELLEV